MPGFAVGIYSFILAGLERRDKKCAIYGIGWFVKEVYSKQIHFRVNNEIKNRRWNQIRIA